MYDDLPDVYEKITEKLADRVPAEHLIILNAKDDSKEGAEIVASPTMKSRPPHQFNITLVLARNLYPRLPTLPDNLPYREYRSDQASVTWIEEWHRAIGAFMTMLESHGFSEKQSKNHLSNVPRIEQAWNTVENQTKEERLEDLKSYLELYSGDDIRFKYAKNYGSPSDVSELSKEQMKLAEELLMNSVKDPGACYESAITALRQDLENERLSYVEGVSLPKYGGMAQAHGWFEIDGNVVEPTWPWHRPIPPEPAVYYGKSIDPQTASDIMAERGRYGSIVSSLHDAV
ncbi:hypothetical protein ACFQO4_20995 [Saliphagus sp. GCM10025334]